MAGPRVLPPGPVCFSLYSQVFPEGGFSALRPNHIAFILVMMVFEAYQPQAGPSCPWPFESALGLRSSSPAGCGMGVRLAVRLFAAQDSTGPRPPKDPDPAKSVRNLTFLPPGGRRWSAFTLIMVTFLPTSRPIS